ncbi:MAG: LacI family DNA-binding transcriptional regulator [Allomuricauda sp.]
MKRITIKEIAKRAGVSIGTVDRVLHNRGEVAAKTKELVLKIANEGNYTTNVYARSLKLNKIYRIAVLLPKDNEYWSTLNNAINKTAERYASLGIHPEFFTFDRHSETSLLQQAQQMLESEPDGVILAPLVEDEIRRLTCILDERDIPYVYVDSNLEVSHPLAFIGQDSFQAGYLAAKLLNLGFPRGHKAYIARFFDFDSLNKTIEERIKGFRDYYETHGYDTQLIFDVDLSSGTQKFLNQIHEAGNLGPVHIFIPSSRAHQLVKELKGFKAHRRTVGFDLINENKACLTRNTIDFIIDQNPSKQGELALQAFYDKLIANTEVRTNQLMALEIFTKENLQGN